MKRMYFLAPSLESVASVSDDLHSNGVDDAHFHVISNREGDLDSRHIHGTHFLRRLDIIHSMERGLIGGVLIGLIAVLILQFVKFEGFEIGYGVQLAIVLFFACGGTWIGGMGGVNSENYKIKPFHDEIDRGKHLMMVDVPAATEPTIRTLMQSRHGEVQIAGVGSRLDNPFTAEDQLVR